MFLARPTVVISILSRKLMCGVAFVVAMVISLPAANANLITNGGFETGTFAGWTTGANSFPQSIVTSPVNSGTYAAEIAGFSYNPNTLSQTIATTAGQEYVLSFWRYQVESGPTISLNVTWNGTSVFSELNPVNADHYQQFSFSVFGTGNDLLTFTSANDPSDTYLDDVSLTSTVPEPSSFALVTLGGLGLAMACCRRRVGNA